tara:strand:+ start:395 stop:1780 length:1386 start_codon:yes stop_codon:yes gene_type:complete
MFSSFVFLFAANFSEWLNKLWTDTLAPRWDSFMQVFVGEDLLVQVGSIAGAFLLAYVIKLGLKPLLMRLTEAIEERDDWVEDSVDWASDNLFRLLLVGLLWAVSLYLDAAAALASDAGVGLVEGPNYILVRALASIATLWLVSGALPRRIKQQIYFKTLFFVLAMALILNLLGVWSVISEGLNGIRLFPISEGIETQVTVLTLLKGLVAILILIPLTGWLVRASESKVKRMQSVSPALQVLALKLIKLVVAVAAIMLAISSMGVNLSAFAFLGGAIGLGLGFGFQKVISNLISGVILLGDRSIKPGDVIEVDQTYGWINTLGARYTSVITRDGTEHLIPNEMMITEKVVNWSFSDEKVRLKIPFGTSYDSDPRQVMKLVLESAEEHPRVLDKPGPVVRLMGFGDSGVDFELRIWIRDPSAGVNNVRSDLYLGIWDTFKEHNIEIPFPQRDLHVKEMPPREL